MNDYRGPNCKEQLAAIRAHDAAKRLAELADAAEDVGVLPGEAAGLEKELQTACELELSRRGIWYLHLSFRARERIGCPDLLFPHPRTGQFCAVELKSATGKASEEQIRALNDILKGKGNVAIIRSYAEFVKFLEEV